jgi:hypothetical protein
VKSVTLPPWFTGWDAPVAYDLAPPARQLLQTLFRFEDSLVKALLKLDRQVDDAKAGKTLDRKALHAAVADVIDSAKDLGDYDASCFTAILDRLIQAGSNGTAVRDSAVIVEVKPRRGPLAGKSVTRFLASGPKNPAEIAEDDIEIAAAAGGRAR